MTQFLKGTLPSPEWIGAWGCFAGPGSDPDLEYRVGDIRTVRLNRQFDAVVIPDSIDYRESLVDLQQAIQTVVLHLTPRWCLAVGEKLKRLF